jgi:hypothetical protein
LYFSDPGGPPTRVIPVKEKSVVFATIFPLSSTVPMGQPAPFSYKTT